MIIKKINNSTSITLDFIRGIAAQLVLIGHLWSFFNYHEIYFPIPLIQNFGVLIFFIMSGFLISQTTFLKGRKYGFKQFFIDRFVRIFYTFIPALFFVLIIDSIGRYYFSYDEGFVYGIKNFFANFFMFQSYPFISNFGIESFGSARPFWTVAIEWWTYIFFGVLFYYRSKIPVKYLTLFAASIIVVIFYVFMRGAGLTIYWFLGFILCLVYNSNIILKNLKIKEFLLLIFILSISLLYRTFFTPNMYDLGIAIITSFIIYLFFNPPNAVKIILDNKLITSFSKFLASYSYSLYLMHYTIIYFYLKTFQPSSIIQFIILFILSYIFYLFFEKTSINLENT